METSTGHSSHCVALAHSKQPAPPASSAEANCAGEDGPDWWTERVEQSRDSDRDQRRRGEVNRESKAGSHEMAGTCGEQDADDEQHEEEAYSRPRSDQEGNCRSCEEPESRHCDGTELQPWGIVVAKVLPVVGQSRKRELTDDLSDVTSNRRRRARAIELEGLSLLTPDLLGPAK